MIKTIEQLPLEEQRIIAEEIREWEEETGRNVITEEDLIKMAEECGEYKGEIKYGFKKGRKNNS